ncbi:hypothetical protein [Endozoicomonas arenosclerae]|uniref:hypothetical protein n=1 Tax=Endozoicomonas arenosclerae TaxID=1633495 RepID=UPI0007819D7A|nr:hypothetical protein [Endozoicomonas arenosclerae]
MYMIRKRFMYWHVPASSRITLKRERGEVYCFFPAKLVKKLKSAVNYIVSQIHDPVAKTIRDRKVVLS